MGVGRRDWADAFIVRCSGHVLAVRSNAHLLHPFVLLPFMIR